MRVSMVRLALAGTFVAGLTTVAAAQDPVQKGEELFTSQKCTMCHSVAGKGNKKFPLDGVGAKLSAADIKEWIVNPDAMEAKQTGPKPVMKMKSFKSLPAADVDALVAYMGSLK
jgi:mono/diheme cytochrome c family protein